jgi:hypothetical protein
VACRAVAYGEYALLSHVNLGPFTRDGRNTRVSTVGSKKLEFTGARAGI